MADIRLGSASITGGGISSAIWMMTSTEIGALAGHWWRTTTEIARMHQCPLTVIPVRSLCGTGNAVADMLLGYYSGVGGFVPGPLSPTDTAGNPQDHVFGYFAPYAMDDWKVSPKLTLNLGLRWDYPPARTKPTTTSSGSTRKTRTAAYATPIKTLTTNGVAPGGDDNSGPILRYCGRVPHRGPEKPVCAEA